MLKKKRFSPYVALAERLINLSRFVFLEDKKFDKVVPTNRFENYVIDKKSKVLTIYH